MGRKLIPYVVRQGDSLAKLAFVQGFDADEIWGLPENAAISGLRRDPNMLRPGDILQLPVRPKEALSLTAGTTNRYVANVPRVHVHLCLRDDAGNALGNEPYEIQGLGPARTGTSTAEGDVSFEAPVVTREVSLLLTERGITLPIRIGDLDPVEESSGVRMRLQHLGLLRAGDHDDGALRSSVRAFQEAQGLPPTGQIDDATRTALITAHGS